MGGPGTLASLLHNLNKTQLNDGLTVSPGSKSVTPLLLSLLLLQKYWEKPKLFPLQLSTATEPLRSDSSPRINYIHLNEEAPCMNSLTTVLPFKSYRT